MKFIVKLNGEENNEEILFYVLRQTRPVILQDSEPNWWNYKVSSCRLAAGHFYGSESINATRETILPS